MQLKQLMRVKYSIQFETKRFLYAAFFIGLSFFLMSVEYFGFRNISQIPSGELVLTLILPLTVLAVFMTLLCGIRLRFAPAYGALGAVYCIYLIIQTVAYSGGGRPVLAVVWYILAAAVLLLTTVGLIPSRIFSVLFFFAPAVYRFVYVDLERYFAVEDYRGFVPEAAILCGLLAFTAFSMCLKPASLKADEE